MRRIEEIDAVRGFALFGILLTHMFEGFLASYIPPQYVDFNVFSSIDRASQFIIRNFFIGKFYAVFSFLFGLSFYLILGQKKDTSSASFAWRMVLLFLIGFAHQAHYRGDFLTVYAVFGMALILFRNLPDRLILIVGLFLAFNGPMILSNGLSLVQAAEPVPAASATAAFENLVAITNVYFGQILNGEYSALLQSNATIGVMNKLNFLQFSGRMWVIPGLFLLGLWIGRKRFHERLDALPLKSIFIASLSVGLPLVFLSYFWRQPGGSELTQYLGFVTLHVSNIFVPLMYIAAILLLMRRPTARRVLGGLVPVGRMGLTVYVMQSLIGVFVFYGYGFGLLLEMSGTVALGLGALIFLCVATFSRWWFSRYAYGPLEWFWRSATKMKLQPIALRT